MNFPDKILEGISNTGHRLEEFVGKIGVRRILFFITVFISFALIYVLNIFHPLFGDDWSYSLAYNGSRLQNFGEILEAQYHHYFTWGGRTVVHIIAQTMLWAGEPIGDILNSLAFVALTLAIYFLAKKESDSYNVSLLIVINLLVWFFQPAFGQTMLWITGSANYLWGTLIIILFLIPFKRYFFDSDKNNSYLKAAVFFFLGVIAGWTNENMAVTLVFILVVFIAYCLHSNRRMQRWVFTGFMGTIVGSILLIAAPGNYVRYNDFAQTDSVVSRYGSQFVEAVAGLYYYSLPLIFIFFLFCVLYYTNPRKEVSKDVIFFSVLMFGGAIIAALAMTAAPFFPGRASFGLNIFFIVAISVLYANLNFYKALVKGLTYISIIFGLLFFAADYYRGYRELKNAHDVLAERIVQMNIAKAKGETDIVFEGESLHPQTRFFHYWELFPYEFDWNNRMFSRYYGIKSVKMIRK